MALTAKDSAIDTAANLKTYLNIGDTSKDTIIDDIVADASAWISTYCGRVFTQATYTEYYHGNGTDLLMLNHWPVSANLATTASGGIWVDSTRQWGANAKYTEHLTDSTTTSGDYTVDTGEKGRGYVWRLSGGYWPRGRFNIKAVYKGGYATIPEDVQLAFRRLGAWMFTRIDRAAHLQVTETIPGGGGTISYGDQEVPKDIRLMLGPYRRRERI